MLEWFISFYCDAFYILWLWPTYGSLESEINWIESEENVDSAHQQQDVWPPWIGLSYLDANLQQIDGGNNQDAWASTWCHPWGTNPMWGGRSNYEVNMTTQTPETLSQEDDHFLIVFVFCHLNCKTDFSSIVTIHFQVSPWDINVEVLLFFFEPLDGMQVTSLQWGRTKR
jgi:hypothetical protein